MINDEQYFWDLVSKYTELLDFDQANPKSGIHQEIEAELLSKYSHSKAVLMLDMSGFTLIAKKYGIVHYLSMIKQMRSITLSRIAAYKGVIIKFIADNCLAVFPEPLAAINFSIAINKTFAIGNVLAPDELDIYISCGIDFGDILMVGTRDCFGDAVNLASKLGEDIAKAGEILVTQKAMNMVPGSAGIKTKGDQTITIKNLDIAIHAVNYK